MPRIAHKINAFNGGEYAPEFYGRTDLPKYSAGARRIENFIVHPEGGAHRRPGSRFVKAAIDSTKKSRLIPFVFSSEQAYMLEFGDQVIRVFADELSVEVEVHELPEPDLTKDEFAITDHGYIDQQGPFRLTTTGTLPTGLSTGTDYYISMPKTFQFDDSDIDFTLEEFTFTDHQYTTDQGPFRVSTTGMLPPGGTDWGANHDYTIIIVDDDTVSLDGGSGAVNIISLLNIGTHTIAPTGDYLRDSFMLSLTPGGTHIDISGAGSGTHTITPNPLGDPTGLVLEIPTPYLEAELYNLHYVQSADFLFIAHKDHRPSQLTRKGNTKWSLDFMNIIDGPYLTDNIDTGITINPGATTGDQITFNLNTATGVNDDEGWRAVDIGRLVRFKNSAGDWGYVEITGVSSSTEAVATVRSTLPVATAQSSWALGSWYTGNWPAALSFFEQRLAMAGEPATPQTLHGSRTNLPNVFTPTEIVSPYTVLDTSALNFQISSNQIDAIRWMGTGRRLVLGTASSLFIARASFDGEAMTPTNINVHQLTAVGGFAVPPVHISDQLIYVTRNSQGLRGFQLASDADTATPFDITLLAKHIFGRTETITTMAYQFDRQQLLWLTRSDGVMPAVTYVPEQEVSAWSRHIIGGNFGTKGTAKTFAAAAVTIASGEITVVLHGYTEGQGPFRLTTSDTLPAGTAVAINYYIQVVDANTIKLRVTPSGAAVDLTDQGVGTHTITESGDAVAESVAVIPAPDGTHDQAWISVKRTIGASTARHIEFFEDEWLDDVTTSMRYVDSAPVAYSDVAVSTISGLDHLEGETVQVLANGAAHPDRVVSSGAITLDDDVYTDVVAGLGYVSELETLDLEFPDPEGSSTGKVARSDHLVLRLYNSLGGKVGPDTDHLDNIEYRDFGDVMDAAPPVFSGDRKISYAGPYQRQKRVVLRQDQPLPLNVLSLVWLGKAAAR